MKIHSRGFGAVEAILIIVVVGLIGLSGYLFWQLQQKSKPAKTDTATTQETKDNAKDDSDLVDTSYELKPVEETANWKTESNSAYGFSYKYPADGKWQTFYTESDKDSQAYKDGELINTAGVNYTACGKNCGLVFSFGVYKKGSKADPGKNFAADRMKDNDFYSRAYKQPVTLDGASGYRSEYAPGNNSVAGIMFYYFTKGDKSYAFILNLNGAVADGINLTERGDRIMETFKF